MSEHKHKGTCDRNGNQIQVGDIVHYYAGSRRHILTEYVCESLISGPDDYKSAPNSFRAIGHDKRLQFTWVPLFELDKWGEVVGSIRETPLEIDTDSPWYRPDSIKMKPEQGA